MVKMKTFHVAGDLSTEHSDQLVTSQMKYLSSPCRALESKARWHLAGKNYLKIGKNI